MTTLDPENSQGGTPDRLRRAGWTLDHRQVVAPYPYTSGRIVRHAKLGRHSAPRTAEVLLRLTRDLPLSVVEVADGQCSPHSALQRATEHAAWLGLPFAHALGPETVLEQDLQSGLPRQLASMPGPVELWQRVKEFRRITEPVEHCLLTPSYHDVHRPLRYHQIRAIHAAVESIARGEKDVRLVLGAGTGRTHVAFQICYRLWAARWNTESQPRRPRVLYLCDGDDLLDAARTGVFAPFNQARHALANGAVKNREIYFATPEMLVRGAPDAPLFLALEESFFDLIVEDRIAPEAAAEDPAIVQALRHFKTAVRLRLFAFAPATGSALFTFSLRQGVEDGVLAPFQLVEIDGESKNWLTSRKGTWASAAALVSFLEATDPLAKTLVFCDDDDHASRMAAFLGELCSARIAEHRNYIGCITPDAAGRVQLDCFRDVDRKTPVIGVATRATPMRGVPTLANVALCAPLESDAALIAQIGQGVYLRPGHGKWHFSVLDFTVQARDALARTNFVAEPDRVSSWSPSEGGGS